MDAKKASGFLFLALIVSCCCEASSQQDDTDLSFFDDVMITDNQQDESNSLPLTDEDTDEDAMLLAVQQYQKSVSRIGQMIGKIESKIKNLEDSKEEMSDTETDPQDMMQGDEAVHDPHIQQEIGYDVEDDIEDALDAAQDTQSQIRESIEDLEVQILSEDGSINDESEELMQMLSNLYETVETQLKTLSEMNKKVSSMISGGETDEDQYVIPQDNASTSKNTQIPIEDNADQNQEQVEDQPQDSSLAVDSPSSSNFQEEDDGYPDNALDQMDDNPPEESPVSSDYLSYDLLTPDANVDNNPYDMVNHQAPITDDFESDRQKTPYMISDLNEDDLLDGVDGFSPFDDVTNNGDNGDEEEDVGWDAADATPPMNFTDPPFDYTSLLNGDDDDDEMREIMTYLQQLDLDSGSDDLPDPSWLLEQSDLFNGEFMYQDKDEAFDPAYPESYTDEDKEEPEEHVNFDQPVLSSGVEDPGWLSGFSGVRFTGDENSPFPLPDLNNDESVLSHSDMSYMNDEVTTPPTTTFSTSTQTTTTDERMVTTPLPKPQSVNVTNLWNFYENTDEEYPVGTPEARGDDDEEYVYEMPSEESMQAVLSRYNEQEDEAFENELFSDSEANYQEYQSILNDLYKDYESEGAPAGADTQDLPSVSSTDYSVLYEGGDVYIPDEYEEEEEEETGHTFSTPLFISLVCVCTVFMVLLLTMIVRHRRVSRFRMSAVGEHVPYVSMDEALKADDARKKCSKKSYGIVV